MASRQQAVVPPDVYQCGTRRQHFNHLRNSSNNMRNILSWGTEQQEESIHNQQQQQHYHHPYPQQSPISHDRIEEEQARQKKNVSFDTTRQTDTQANSKPNPSLPKKPTASPAPPSKPQDRPRSASNANKKSKDEQADEQLRRTIRQRELQQQAERQVERREKVKKFIEELKPYTRSLTNTKYQDYFNKAALESYGRANLKNAIGGIIYGNHQKTFNLNPHIRGNEPKHYQTHQTAINYGKRTKLNQDDKWTRLQKELTKKLGLKDKNETLKEGKEVVVVDVDQTNMYSIMKENLGFKKEHDAEIRKLEADYKAGIEEEKKAAVEQFYADKKARILSGTTIDAQTSHYVCPRDERGRLQEQVIYRHTDKNGIVRMGADRHALTCFVDMNFPQNDAAYTQELINRMPIFPVEVEDKDKFIDDQRRANYQKSLENIYPSHYLLPNCDQPEVIKMINNKYGEIQQQKQAETKNLGSTFGTTRLANSSLVAH